MNRIRLISGLSLCAASVLLAACGDDDDAAPQPAGNGGSAGATAGAAGKSGTAGKAGSTGTAGKAGATSAGGNGGALSAGAGGAAGKGGSSAGASGSGGNGGTTAAGQGGATSAGAGGQAGSGQAGQGGKAQAGQGGSGQAGQGGKAQAGQGGSAQAGQGGAAQAGQAGQGGSAQAGQGGSGQAGQGGSAQAGQGGSAQAGQGGSGQGGAGGKAGSNQGGSGGAGGAFSSKARHTPRGINTLYPGNGFWEYLPPSYSENGAKSPLIVFWHGLGENGDGSVAGVDGNGKPTGLQKVPSNGPPRFINENKWPADRPFVVLSPQNTSGCPSAASIKSFTTFAIDHYNVDPKRLYLTGLSCGGIGISDYLAANVDTTPYSAVVTVSGKLTSAWNAQQCDLGKVALWGIHGDADANGGTPPAGTKGPMQDLINCAQPPRRDARLTMIPGGTHSDNSWDTTYGGTLPGVDIYTWFLENPLP